MRRRLLNLLTVLSLLLCAMTLAVRASGYQGSPSPVWSRDTPVQRVSFSVGIVGRSLTLGVVTPPTTAMRTVNRWKWGFGHDSGGASSVQPGGALLDIGYYRGIAVPLWLVSLAMVIPPLWWAAKRWRRPRPGCCPSCGYDLRATPDRCPECGEPAAVISDG